MRSRFGTVVLALCAAASGGCAYLRVPRIDPTGQRIFAEPPIAAVPQYQDEPAGQLPWDDVAITLSPHTTVAPVGSEVVLVAGVRGVDNYLRTNRRLEWSLAAGGVGHFVAVGRNGLVDLLLGDFNRPRKIDNTFAVGSTSRRYLRLNRGTPTPLDDVCVLRGQGWITLTSPVEGTSYVTVYAPDVNAWDSHIQGATIHWVDAQWRFPPPAINPSGTRHILTTMVMRQSNQCPCVGWRVRYEILSGPAAGFSPDGAQSVEVATDATGQASAEIFQKEPRPGTNTIGIQIIRPATLGGSNGRQLVVGNGTTTKAWTSPDLALRKTGPASAGPGTTLGYRIDVSNPGDLPAEEVVVTDELPEGLTYLDSDPPAEVNGRKLRWRLGQLAASESRTLKLNCRAGRQGSVTNCADATAAGGLKASDCAVTTVMAPTIDVNVTAPVQATVGSEVTFRMVITNRSQVTAKGLLIKDRFGEGLQHAAARSPIERDLGDLGPGQSRQIDVTFRVTKAGRLCHTVEVIGAGGVKATTQGCVTAVEAAAAESHPPGIRPPGIQPPPQPGGRTAVTIKKTLVGGQRDSPLGTSAELPSHIVGETARFTIDITNTGTQTLTNLKVVDQYDPSLGAEMATDGYELENNNLVWNIDSLAAGKTERLEVHCLCRTAVAKASNRATVTTQEGARAEDVASLEIRTAPGGLTMAVADLHDPVAAGKELTYELRVTNQGQVPATQVGVVASVPIGMRPVPLTTSGPTKYTIERQSVVFEPVAEVRPGETLTYRVHVSTRLPGKLTFRAVLTSPDLAEPLAVEETTEVFQ